MAEVLEQIEQVVREARQQLAVVKTADQLEQFRIKFLGTKGAVKDLMTLVGKVPKEQKPVIGQRANAAKNQITEAFEARKLELSSSSKADHEGIDITEPGQPTLVGNKHVLMKTIDELTELFGRMGFGVATGPEVEDEFHNFVALNIPKQHPARDPLDNFYLAVATGEGKSTPGDMEGGAKLLRTQTSTVQIRVMETTKPPIR